MANAKLADGWKILKFPFKGNTHYMYGCVYDACQTLLNHQRLWVLHLANPLVKLHKKQNPEAIIIMYSYNNIIHTAQLEMRVCSLEIKNKKLLRFDLNLYSAFINTSYFIF